MNQNIVKAARNGNIYAILGLAYQNQHSLDVGADPEEAIRLYTASAERGCARAKWELAKIYRDGEIIEPDPHKFMDWLMAAADAGVPEAMMDLALRYINGILVTKNSDSAYSLITKVAEIGYPEGEFYLGIAYTHGVHVDKNLGLAELLFARAREHGDAEFIISMGRKLEFGLDGIGMDLEMARNWYKYAADMGSDKGLYSYLAVEKVLKSGKCSTPEERQNGLMNLPSAVEERRRSELLEMADIAMDASEYTNAFKLYEEAAELGNSEALFMLAVLYHDGEIVRRNDEISYGYLERAAIAGSAEANMELGRIYENGRGRKENKALAVQHYARAVALGNLLAYYELSRFMSHPEKYVREHHKIQR